MSDLKTEGTPEWFTEAAFRFFTEKYLYDAKTPREQYLRIATTCARHSPNPEYWGGQFFDMLWYGEYSASSPSLANTGTRRGYPVACSGVYVPDSILGFMDTRKENALYSQAAMGTSYYGGDIRPRGSQISRGGTASGAITEFEAQRRLAQEISQGGIRRGSVAGYFPIMHGDFHELWNFVDKNPADSQIGWCLNDAYKHLLENRDVEAGIRWEAINFLRAKLGKGYMFFDDKVNRARPEALKRAGHFIKASNLCVAPETLILTTEGDVPIKGRCGLLTNVWNGKRWSTVVVHKTGINKRLFKVKLTSGKSLECTWYHKWYVRHYMTGVIRCKRTYELNAGDVLEQWATPEGHVAISESVVSVQDEGRIDATYCFTEPEEGKGVFNGILTGNCAEITLPADEQYSFSCVLGALNLVRWDSIQKNDTIFTATVFLDCLASEFISLAKGREGFDKIVRFTEDFRALGLGVMGLHSHYQYAGMPFGSMEAHLHNASLFKQIHDKSLLASQYLAGKLGEPKLTEGLGVRNTHRTAMMPTMSTAVIMGGYSEGIGPMTGNAFLKDSAAGEEFVVNPWFDDLLADCGKSGGEYRMILRSVAAKDGSIAHLDFISEHDKKIGLTAFEINQRDVLRQASTRQKFICQGQSINLHVSMHESEQIVSDLHAEAFDDEGVHSLYYLRGSDKTPAQQDMGCELCQ